MSSQQLILNQKTRAVLMPASMFDQATIIDSSGEDVGFPISNLKDPQPKRKWHDSPGGDPIATYFVVDLGSLAAGRQWNCAIPLFHNGFSDQATNRWRVRTGDTTSGTGFYDSDWMPLWQSPTVVAGGPNNPESAGFYRIRGLGPHSHFILPRQGTLEGVSNFLQFRGGSVGFGDVLDQDSIDSGGAMNIVMRLRIPSVGLPFSFTYTVLQKGISDVLTGAGASGGYSIAVHKEVDSLISVVVTYNDGTGDITIHDTADTGDFLTTRWNEIAVTVATTGFGGAVQVLLNGELSSTPLVGNAIQSSASPLIWGQNSAGGQVADSLDVERVIFSGAVSGPDIYDEMFASDLRSIEIPSSWNAYAVYPNDAGLGSTIEDIYTSDFHGAIAGSVSWGNEGEISGVPNLLFNRYARFDFESSNTPTWKMARFFMGLALEPITPYGTAMPTPLGTPPKVQVTWPMRLTREQFEFIAYALAADSGNAPEVLESWGHDIHLIDGGKTVVSVNNIEAEFPWQRQQQTVYGYIQSLEEVRTLNTGLIEANLTIRGM